jgi:APA family basic amino acid/polyamine antiporter
VTAGVAGAGGAGSEAGERTIGTWTCASLVAGNMIGSGIFLLPAALAAYGSVSFVGWLLTSGGALLLALLFSGLCRAMPAAGGPYAYTRAGLGDFAGFLVAWGYWISLICGNAAIAVAMVGYLGVFFGGLQGHALAPALVALAALWLLTAVNLAGVRSAGRMQIMTTLLKLLPLVAIIVVGLFAFDAANLGPFNASGEPTLNAVSATAALTLWAFLGLEAATVPADDVRDPAKTIPRATVAGTVTVAVIYILATLAVMGLVSHEQLAVSEAPFADAAERLWGPTGAWLVAAGATVSCFGALNGWILLTGQVPMAAARDRLFPAHFARRSARGVPAVGLVVSSVFATVLILMNYTRGLVGLFTFAILLSTLTALVPYAFSAVARLRLLSLADGRASRAALFVAAAAFVYSFWAIAGAGEDVVYLGFMLLLAGLPVYAWLTRGRRAEDAAESSS